MTLARVLSNARSVRQNIFSFLTSRNSIKYVPETKDFLEESTRLQIDGLNVLNLRDIVEILEKESRYRSLRGAKKKWSAIQNELSYLTSGSIMSGDMTWVIGPSDETMARMMRKLYCTIVGDKPWDDIYISPSDLRWMGVRPLQVYSKQDVPIIHSSSEAKFANSIRTAVLVAGSDELKEKVSVIGASYEDIFLQERLKFRAENFGVTESAFSLDRVFEASDVKEFKSMGQVKLRAVDRPMFCFSDVVIAIGGSPGEHFGSLLREKPVKQELIIIDDRRPEVKCRWIDKRVSADWSYDGDEPYSLIVDIRSDREVKYESGHVYRRRVRPIILSEIDIEINDFDIVKNCKFTIPDAIYNPEGVTWLHELATSLHVIELSSLEGMEYVRVIDDDWNRRINTDNFIMDRILLTCANDDLCQAISLKIHPGGSDLLVRGDISNVYYQPWASTYTHETRFIAVLTEQVRYSLLKMRTRMPLSEYVKRVRAWNSNFSLMQEQERRLASLGVRRKKITEFKGNVVSTFAISNVINDRELVFKALKVNGRSFHLVPRESEFSIDDRIVNSLLIETKKKKRRYFQLRQNKYIDHMYHPDERDGFFSYSSVDMILYARASGVKLPGCEPRGRSQYLWFVMGNMRLFSRYQDWLNSQTHLVRLSSAEYRRVLSVDRVQMHSMRIYVSRLLYDGYERGSKRYDGKIQFQKRQLSVAGHMTNMLLASEVATVCFKRYLDTIEMNVLGARGGRAQRTAYSTGLKSFLKRGMLAEQNLINPNKLWHTYDEWRIAVGTYIYMRSADSFRTNFRACAYVLRRLNEILERVPDFRG
jgi:hypothetical protein